MVCHLPDMEPFTLAAATPGAGLGKTRASLGSRSFWPPRAMEWGRVPWAPPAPLTLCYSLLWDSSETSMDSPQQAAGALMGQQECQSQESLLEH